MYVRVEAKRHLGYVDKKNIPSIAPGRVKPRTKKAISSTYGNVAVKKTTLPEKRLIRIMIGGIQKLRRQEGVGGWSVKCLR